MKCRWPICVLVPVIVAGSMNLNVRRPVSQTGLFWNWYVFHDPFTFLAFWTLLHLRHRQLQTRPFDLAEAESELVAGFHTEYSGFRWLFFFMAEYGSMFAVSGIAVLLFLGGWHTGLLPLGAGSQRWRVVLGNLINVVVFILKGWVLVFVMMWVRWTLARLRIDQVMMTCLNYLLPISCVLLLGVSPAGNWRWSSSPLARQHPLCVGGGVSFGTDRFRVQADHQRSRRRTRRS